MKRPIVLIVEDCPDDQVLMALAARQAQTSFESVVVTSGEEALDWLFCRGCHENRSGELFPALVLLDLKLPLLSGLGLLQTLREDPRGRLIPVVVLTTSEMPCDISKAYESGANAYVQKPMALSGLVSLVEAVQAFWLSFNVIHPAWR
jgi:CheY-like chemotaxis protein